MAITSPSSSAYFKHISKTFDAHPDRIESLRQSFRDFTPSNLHHKCINSLAFVAGFKRATDEGSLPEVAQYSPYYLPLNVLLLPKDQTFIF